MSLDDLIPNVSVPEGTCGVWRVEKTTITEEEARFANLRNSFRPGARTCRPGTITKLMRGGTLVMSDTWDEKRDHSYFVHAAKGSVLIHGLGLGMVLGAVLAKPDVTEVTVVEIAPEVIELVSHVYQDPRVTIINADCRMWKPPVGKRYDAVWHDIWDDICADNLDEMKSLHRRFGRRSAWQGSWARGLCERYA